MIKEWLLGRWPRLRLRTVLLGTFLFVASLPGFGAVFMRVYENTLVRQTESELIAQGAVLVATAGGRFEAAAPPAPDLNPQSRLPNTASYDSEPATGAYYRPESPAIDLNSNNVLDERQDPVLSAIMPDAAAKARAATLAPIIDQVRRTTLASIILLDRHGTILTGAAAGKSYGHVGEVQRALSGKTVTVLRRNAKYAPRYAFEWISRAAMVRVHHVRPIIINGKVEGAVLLSRSSRALFRGIYQDRGKIGVAIALIFSILVILTLLLHRSIAKPIEALSAATRDVAAGRGSIPNTPRTAATEIQALYEDFREMAEVIARRSRYLRDFAAAVSHEFKTPLAGIRGAIELIEDHHGSMTAKERKQFLGNISADADRLSSLVGRLMALAKADMARPDADVATDMLAAIARSADVVRGDQFAVLVDLPKNLPPVAVPEAAVETIMLTLFDNSAQHGATQVSITLVKNADQLFVMVADNGAGVAESDRARLFEPFFTTRRVSGGTGLGLSIARSLIEASHGSITLDPSSQGATFRLIFPVKSA